MKHNSYFKLVFALLLSGCFSMSYAADWYISSTGNDGTGNGSAGLPWASFSKAQSMAADAPDDLVPHLTCDCVRAAASARA